MQRSRLFHAVVLAGASWGAAVAGCSSDPNATAEETTPDGAAPQPSPTTSGAPDGGLDVPQPSAEGGSDAGIGTSRPPEHVMTDAGAHDADAGPDGGWPPTK